MELLFGNILVDFTKSLFESTFRALLRTKAPYTETLEKPQNHMYL